MTCMGVFLADKIQNDHLFISHYHDPQNGYTYLEDGNDWLSDGQMSSSSVVRKPAVKQYSRIPQPVNIPRFFCDCHGLT